MEERTVFERFGFLDRTEAEQVAEQFRFDGWDALVLRERDGSFAVRAFPPDFGSHEPASNEGSEPADLDPPPLGGGTAVPGVTPPPGPTAGSGPAAPETPVAPAVPTSPGPPTVARTDAEVTVDEPLAPPVAPVPLPRPRASPVVLLTSAPPPPSGAKALLDFIAQFESAGNYNARFRAAGNQNPRFTEMTLRDVLGWQRDFIQKGSPSSAVGRYQIIQKTLLTLIERLALDTARVRFDEQLQDRLGTNLLEVRGLDKFLADEISPEAFANSVSREWAALPIVSDDFPDHQGRLMRKGFSYYSGVGNNKAHAGVEGYLRAVRAIRG